MYSLVTIIIFVNSSLFAGTSVSGMSVVIPNLSKAHCEAEAKKPVEDATTGTFINSVKTKHFRNCVEQK